MAPLTLRKTEAEEARFNCARPFPRRARLASTSCTDAISTAVRTCHALDALADVKPPAAKQILKHYSHIRMEAKRRAVEALEAGGGRAKARILH